MALFPQQFIDDLKQHADIVVVIQDYVSLKKTGATYKGSARSTVRRRHRSMSIATRGFSTVSGAGRAATSSSSWSCARVWAFRTPCGCSRSASA